MNSFFRLAYFTVAGWLVEAAFTPRLRAAALRAFGARVGRGVRVHRCALMNHHDGLRHLEIGDGVFIGDGVVLDLAGPLRLADRATVSVRAILLTHTDPGASHGNAQAVRYPPTRRGLSIGRDAWIGAGAIILEGADLAPEAVIGAGAVVVQRVTEAGLYGGVPARRLR
jgi:acetyltransferase-like isoleucine patch superfamily enzyme